MNYYKTISIMYRKMAHINRNVEKPVANKLYSQFFLLPWAQNIKVTLVKYPRYELNTWQGNADFLPSLTVFPFYTRSQVLSNAQLTHFCKFETISHIQDVFRIFTINHEYNFS